MLNTFAKEGVRLSYFSDFIVSCGGYENLKDLTTTDVCERFVKPMTTAGKCSVCELLRYENNVVLPQSNVFISHAWQYKFLDVVEAIRFSLTDGDSSRENDFVVWFDLFTVNQHGLDQPPPFLWWCNTFKTAISEIGHTVMVLSPWENPVTLTRAWCLFELYATADCQCRFSIAMSSEESQRFLSDMENHGVSCLNTMLATVNVEQSQARNPLDRDQIFDVVRQSVGFSEINLSVLRLLRQWTLDVMEKQYSRAYETLTDINPQKLAFTSLLGDLYVSLGLYTSAETRYMNVFTTLKEDPNAVDTDVVSASTNVANVLMLQDHLSKAGNLYQQCFSHCRACFGESHPLSLQAMRNLCYALIKQKLLDEAEQLCMKCWDVHKSTYGECHKLTLGVVNNWMGLYSYGADAFNGYSSPCPRTQEKFKSGYYYNKFKDAAMVDLFRRSLKQLTELLGRDHPLAIDARGNMSIVLHSDMSAALAVMEETVDLLTIKRGQDHPVTLSMMRNLALLHCEADREAARYNSRAKLFYENWLRSRKIDMHKRHPHLSVLDCKNAIFAEVGWPDNFHDMIDNCKRYEQKTLRQRRISKEFNNIMNSCLTQEHELDRYFAGPHRGDLWNWVGYVIGPPGSVYEGEPYRLSIRVSYDYPYKPLEIRFTDTIFHPCITPTDPEHCEKLRPKGPYGGLIGKGVIDCLDLKDGYSPAYTVPKFLGILEEMLVNPLAAVRRTGHGGIYFEDKKWNFFVVE